MNLAGKIVNWEEATRLRQAWAGQGEKVVFTNGCFDLMHLGHVNYLSAARGLGDRLIVGLNSDDSVKRLKGPGRPITPVEQRAGVLAALEPVSLVAVFDDDDPYRLIARLGPDVLVKGGDWPVERIVGRDIVAARGGLVTNIPLTPGLSTTAIIERIAALSRR